MKAGNLDQRIVIERLVKGVDPIGQPINAWEPVFSVWAAVEPLQGREYIAAQAVQSEVEARIRLRYRPGVTSAMRVIHGADTYSITSVIHVKSAKQELQIMCRANG